MKGEQNYTISLWDLINYDLNSDGKIFMGMNIQIIVEEGIH